MGAREGLRDSKVRALGPHVAVRDSPYPVAHPACLAGVDGQDRERHRRDQEPAHLRRVMQMDCVGHFQWPTRLTLWFDSAAMVFVDGFSLVLVASPPRLPLWTIGFFLEFVGPTVFG